MEERFRNRLTRSIVCAMMAALLGLLSWVSVPIPVSPIPVTLQTLGVFLAGGLLGPMWGPGAVLLYIALGGVGAPVFAGGEVGVGVLAGPKGGYLVGFVLAATLVGVAARYIPEGALSRRRFAMLGSAVCAASLVVYLCGVPWLAWVTGMNLKQAALVGALPYVPGDVIKGILALVLLRALMPALRGSGLGERLLDGTR